MKQVKQSSWTTRHRDDQGASRADRRRRGERGPNPLRPPAPPISGRDPWPPVSTPRQWRRALLMLFAGLLLTALWIGLFDWSKHKPAMPKAAAASVHSGIWQACGGNMIEYERSHSRKGHGGRRTGGGRDAPYRAGQLCAFAVWILVGWIYTRVDAYKTR